MRKKSVAFESVKLTVKNIPEAGCFVIWEYVKMEYEMGSEQRYRQQLFSGIENGDRIIEKD